jgi:hypothetical protein
MLPLLEPLALNGLMTVPDRFASNPPTVWKDPTAEVTVSSWMPLVPETVAQTSKLTVWDRPATRTSVGVLTKVPELPPVARILMIRLAWAAGWVAAAPARQAAAAAAAMAALRRRNRRREIRISPSFPIPPDVYFNAGPSVTERRRHVSGAKMVAAKMVTAMVFVTALVSAFAPARTS